MTKYLHFLLLLCLVSPIQAKNYFVSKNGSDSNEGTESAPFLTISKAASLLTAGDTCFIMAGVYRETIEPSKHGEAGHPIVFTHFENDSVTISATELLNTWDKHSNDIYKASYSMALGRQNRVFCNGEPMDWARWPNNTDKDSYTVQGVRVISGSGSTIESTEIPDLDWNGGYVWYLGGHSGTSWTREITASASGKVTFKEVNINKWPFNPHNPTVVRNHNRGQFYLFGTLDALDYEREWYFDSKNNLVYFQAPNNADPNQQIVEIAQRSRTMYLTKDYVHIDGIHAFGGKIEITGSNCVVKNSTFKHCLHILDELDNTDAQVGDASVLVRASNTIVENNVIDGGSLNGIFVQGWNNVSDVTIQHNLIQNFNTVGIHASPIRTSAKNMRIISNTLKTTGRDGIYNGGTDAEIAYNDVSDCMRINNDGGVFYTVGNANDKNNSIHHNWFHDSYGPEYADGRAAGIYLDNHSKGYNVHHNVVWNITWSAVQINWDNWNIDIFNNSFYNVGAAMGRWENGFTIKDIVLKNNYADKKEWIGTDIASTSNIINDKSPFMDIDNHDFRPSLGSLLTNQGEEIEGYTNGFSGSKPDIGAYERGLTPWVPGVNTVKGGEIDDTITGIDDIILEKQHIFVYPNPTVNKDIHLQFNGITRNKTISIFDYSGKQVFQHNTQAQEVVIPESTFPSNGLYIIKVGSEQQNWVKKVIVQ